MFRKSILLFLLLSIFVFTGNAQYTPFDSWGIGLNASLYGFGVQGATTLSPNFKLRVGVDYFSYTDKESEEFDIDVIFREYEVTTKARLNDTKITFPNFKAMVDYYPAANSIFSITGGLYFGNNHASTNGLIDDYEALVETLGDKPVLRFEDIVITPNDDGSFDGKLEMGNTIKPYLGIGIGRTIPRNRVGVKFELGMVYQGKYSLSSPNINESGNDWFDTLIEELELPFSKSLLKLWPMLNISDRKSVV